MKPESLQALLVDRALGELSPETGELMDAYLAQNPAVAPLAQEVDFTLRQSRRAVVTCSKPELPRLKLPDVEVDPSRERGLTVAWFPEWGRLAACLAAGAALGWAAHLAEARRSESSGPMRVAVPQLVRRTKIPQPAANPGFWSVHTLSAERPRTELAPRYRLRWASPDSKPVVEEIP